MIRVAINGFGRIGRQVLQAGIDNPHIEWVAINDLSPVDNLAYLLKYDSVYGRFPGTVDNDAHSITVNGKRIEVFNNKDPSTLPWKEHKVDVVLECTGFFTAREGAALHLEAGAKKVLISAPSKDADFDIVIGVNEHDYKGQTIVSNCSCTTNAAATVAKVLDDNFNLKRGMLITAHGYTASQKLIDGPDKKDFRRGRHAAENIIPTSTGAAKAVVKVIPHLQDKLDAYAWRVPVPVGSIVSIIAEVEKPTNVEKLNWLFEQASEHHLKGILGYAKDPIVLKDIVKDPRSSIFDSHSTKVIDGTFINVSAWYDNEWGFSHRMVEVLELMGKTK